MEYTTDEKIDYIYKELKSQKRHRYFSLFTKIAIVLFVIYGYFQILPKLDTGFFADKIVKLAQPITESMVENMLNSNKQDTTDTKGISESVINKIKSNPDLLKDLFK